MTRKNEPSEIYKLHQRKKKHERRCNLIAMADSGLPLEFIAVELGYKNAKSAGVALSKARRDFETPPPQKQRELNSLDRIAQARARERAEESYLLAKRGARRG